MILSSQELRQALFAGEYSEFLDERSAASTALQGILGKSGPDPRMRDVEILHRHISFALRLDSYRGRMKRFLDNTGSSFTASWESEEQIIRDEADQLDEATSLILDVFGPTDAARRPGSRSFNRAIFDSLTFYLRNPTIREAVIGREAAFKDKYAELLTENHPFSKAAAFDTAGIPNTLTRLVEMGSALGEVTELGISPPRLEEPGNENDQRRIVHDGFE